MSDVSPLLALPLILADQAQKHVTHNEAIDRLDVLVQLVVEQIDAITPPPAAVEGQVWALGEGPVGAWAGQALRLASWRGGTWVFIAPAIGWRAWVRGAGVLRVFTGSGWVGLLGANDLQNLAGIGINTTSDATNKLAVASAATLLSHAGAGHQVKVNKATPGDTASLLYQSGWSGRAEMGLAGSDDFSVKVSPDGSAWSEALTVSRASGVVSFPSGVTGVSPPQFGSGPILTTGYAASKGTDLVVNGTGLLGNNYNFAKYMFDSVVTPGLPGAFKAQGYYTSFAGGIAETDEYLPVNPNLVYRLSEFFRQDDYAHMQYAGLLLYDADFLPIQSPNHGRYWDGATDSLTTLAAPLTPGDTVVSLTSAAGWNNTSQTADTTGLTIFAYKNTAGFKYDNYSRISQANMFLIANVNKSTNTVTLTSPFPSSMGNPDDVSGTWPTGTRIANRSSGGGTYKYSLYSSYTHSSALGSWRRVTNFMGGVDNSGKNVARNFSPGTAYAKFFWLPNYTNRVGGYGGHPDSGPLFSSWHGGVSVVPEVSAKLVANADGSKAIKVLRINAAGTASEVADTSAGYPLVEAV